MFIALSFGIDTEILGCKRQQFLQMRPNFLMSGIAAQLYNVFSFWTDYSKLHIKGKFTDKKLQKISIVIQKLLVVSVSEKVSMFRPIDE